MFSEVFKDKGGLYASNTDILLTYKSKMHSVLQLLLVKYNKLDRIHFDFINNKDLGASVRKYDEDFYVGINIGTYFLLRDMFSKMFSHKDVLDHIGNSSIEREEKLVIDAMFNNGVVTSLMQETDTFHHVNDPIRNLHALAYTEFALTFLLIHECAHIIRGHLGFLLDKKTIWNEIGDNKFIISNFNIPYQQTLEMDADSMATNWAFIFAYNTMYDKNFYVSPMKEFLYKDMKTFISHWSFSIYSMFRLMGFKSFDLIEAKSSSHPPTKIRISMITSNMMTIFLTKFSKEEIHELALQNIYSEQEAEKSFCKVTYSENDFHNYALTYLEEEQKEYFFEVARNWNIIRPYIENYAFGELPPLNYDV